MGTMEGFSEKDAARSKWRLTQRHSRGRGRGSHGGRGRGGKAARPAVATGELGSNMDRCVQHLCVIVGALIDAAVAAAVVLTRPADLLHLCVFFQIL